MQKLHPKILFLSTLVALMVTSCANDSEVVEQQAPKATPVEAAIAHMSSHDISRGFTGTLVGEKQAEIHARIAEAVDRVLVIEGQSVKKDQVLIQLDKSGPASTYRNAESLYRNAEKNHVKQKYLYEQGAISESQYDAALTTYEVAKASFESVKQLVEIRSPINGVVTSLNISEGDYLQLGTKLVTIAALENLRVTFGVNTRDVATIRIGDTVMISSSSVKKTVPGVVIAIAQSADPKTRAFEIEAQLANSSTGMHPGMFVRASVVLERWRDVIIIPHEAVVELDNQQTVFVVKDGTVHKRGVSIVGDISQGVIIGDGLNVGDTLVTLGQTYLDDGFNVKITSLETNNR
jgi:RND family efflux transporter MFP subunit